MASSPEALRVHTRALRTQPIAQWPWAMALTWVRIGLVPVYSALWLTLGPSWAGIVVLLCASVSDWFDGFLARRLNQCSELGAFLDPVADKLLVVSALLLLLTQHPGLAIPSLVIVMREITISALRAWRSPDQLRVDRLAKLKTVAQMLSVLLLVLSATVDSPLLFLAGSTVLWAAAILSLVSLGNYIRRLG